MSENRALKVAGDLARIAILVMILLIAVSIAVFTVCFLKLCEVRVPFFVTYILLAVVAVTVFMLAVITKALSGEEG